MIKYYLSSRSVAHIFCLDDENKTIRADDIKLDWSKDNTDIEYWKLTEMTFSSLLHRYMNNMDFHQLFRNKKELIRDFLINKA